MKRFLFPLFLACACAVAAVAAGPSFEIKSGSLVVPGEIVFETGTAKIDAKASAATLAHAKAFLETKTDITLLRIEAHFDKSSTPKQAQELTERRALAVARWLVDNGVDCKRVLPVGFGDTKPVASNQSPEGRAENRRVVFAPAALRGRAIGGLPADGGGRPAGDPCKP